MKNPLLPHFKVTPKFVLNSKIYEPIDGSSKILRRCRRRQAYRRSRGVTRYGIEVDTLQLWRSNGARSAAPR